jgi:hypothetical protein
MVIIYYKTENRNQKNALKLHEDFEQQAFPNVRIKNATAFFERNQVSPHLDE